MRVFKAVLFVIAGNWNNRKVHHIFVCPHSGILFGNKKEQIIETFQQLGRLGKSLCLVKEARQRMCCIVFTSIQF